MLGEERNTWDAVSRTCPKATASAHLSFYQNLQRDTRHFFPIYVARLDASRCLPEEGTGWEEKKENTKDRGGANVPWTSVPGLAGPANYRQKREKSGINLECGATLFPTKLYFSEINFEYS